MSFKSKFQNWFYLDEEDEQQVEKPREEQPRQQQQAAVKEQPRRKKTQRPQAVTEEQSTATARVVSLQSAQKSSKVVLVEPRVYAEAQDISEQLKNKRAVVVNLQRIDREQ